MLRMLITSVILTIPLILTKSQSNDHHIGSQWICAKLMNLLQRLILKRALSAIKIPPTSSIKTNLQALSISPMRWLVNLTIQITRLKSSALWNSLTEMTLKIQGRTSNRYTEGIKVVRVVCKLISSTLKVYMIVFKMHNNKQQLAPIFTEAKLSQ